MGIARIARHDALYDASASGQTFDAEEGAIINPIDVAEIADAGSTKETGIKRNRIQVSDESLLVIRKCKPSKFHGSNTKLGNRKPILRGVVYCICGKAFAELKPDGEITIRSPIVGWAGWGWVGD